MPEINQWAIRKAASCELCPLQNGMDGTRVIHDTMLVGEQFPPDVRSYPKETELPAPDTPEQLRHYIFNVRENWLYAAEAYSLNLSDTTGLLSDIVIGVIPEATKGITGAHIFSLMMEVEKHSEKHTLPLIGHCTDSASNALNALVKLASPVTYSKLKSPLNFLGLTMENFIFCTSYSFKLSFNSLPMLGPLWKNIHT